MDIDVMFQQLSSLLVGPSSKHVLWLRSHGLWIYVHAYTHNFELCNFL